MKEFQIHINNEHEKLQCEECGIVMFSMSNLNSHTEEADIEKKKTKLKWQGICCLEHT